MDFDSTVDTHTHSMSISRCCVNRLLFADMRFKLNDVGLLRRFVNPNFKLLIMSMLNEFSYGFTAIGCRHGWRIYARAGNSIS